MTPLDAPALKPNSRSGPENAQAPDAWPRAASHETTPSPDTLGVDWAGRRGAFFWLALKTGVLTILTLGFYRFWMKTRMRRYIWSSIRPGGHPLEYTGDPFEKLLGFFIAVVVLTFYLGVFNLLLMFVSFSVFEGTGVGYAASFLGVIPLWFYATYRARRYVLGRTRWRGVRFTLEPAAWAYTGRALLHWGITILSLGALWPRMTFYLEKFRTDRTVFGDLRLEQAGTWKMLYRAAWPLVSVLSVTVLYAVWILVWQPVFPGVTDWSTFETLFEDWPANVVLGENDASVFWPERLWWTLILLMGVIYGLVHYSAASTRIMVSHKRANGLTLVSTLKPARIFMIYGVGYTVAYLTLAVGIILMVIVALATFGMNTFAFDLGDDVVAFENWPRWLGVSLTVVIYFAVFLLWSVFYNTFVTYPRMRHLAVTLALSNVAVLSQVSQGARDTFAEAEGFAEALDLGAAI